MKKQENFTLKDFQIIKQLGYGSFGRVQLVKRKEDQKYYALKSMFLANAKQKQKESALNEIRLLASIDMPYVISYKSSFYLTETQTLYIVMEYANGGDLERQINERAELYNSRGFEESFIWKTAFHLLKGLKGLHQHHIIHRDIKCGNIFFVGGIAKIGDLNISKITENGFASTQTGTPYYTSPEIWKGLQYDYKCDVWALGCIIYEMCALIPPFRAQDFPGLYKTIIKGQYNPIPQNYSKNLKDFIDLCLKIQPHQRPSAARLLQKKYFSDYQLSIEVVQSQLQTKNEISLIDPIQCPKLLRFLNQKLPKSKYQQNNKKTVCFATRDIQSAASFKIKTKKIRSQKTIVIQKDDDDEIDDQDILRQLRQQKPEKNVPKFIGNRINRKLMPRQKDFIGMRAKSAAKLPGLKQQPKSMKNIIEKQNKKFGFK